MYFYGFLGFCMGHRLAARVNYVICVLYVGVGSFETSFLTRKYTIPNENHCCKKAVFCLHGFHGME